MTDDLVKRLREPAYQTAADCMIKQKAADHIEKLEEALRKIATQEPDEHAWCVGIARAALSESK